MSDSQNFPMVVRDALIKVAKETGNKVEVGNGHLTVFIVQNRTAGYKPRELAKLLRISPDRVRTLIRRGELPAVDMSKTRCGRPCYVVMAEGLLKFLAGRAVVVPQLPRAPRPQKKDGEYY